MYGFKAAHQRKGYADGGVISRLFSGGQKETVSEKFARQDAELKARMAAKAGGAPAPTPSAAGAVDTLKNYGAMSVVQRREKEAGLRDGGIVRGPGTGTSDSIKTEMPEGTFIMPADSTEAIGTGAISRLAGTKAPKVPVRVSNGEFEITPEQAQSVGVAVLTLLRDATHQPAQEGAGFRDGGLVQEEKDSIRAGRRAAPYVDHRMYEPPQAQRALPNYAPGPGTAVATQPYRPNFTMGGQAGPTGPAGVPAPGAAEVTDARAKFNPDNASKEAKVWMAERAGQPAAAPAAPGPVAAAPAAAAPQGAISRAATRLRGAVNGPTATALAPVALGTTALAGMATPTEDYEQRFGFQPSASDSNGVRFLRDVGVRALGAASDLGNVLGFGVPGMLYRDRQAQAATPATPPAAPAPAPSGARTILMDTPQGSVAPAVEPAPVQTAPVADPVAASAPRVSGPTPYGVGNVNQAGAIERLASAQNPDAMNFGAYVPGQGLDNWQARQDRKNAETGASSIVNSTARDTARRTLAGMDAQALQAKRNAGELGVAALRADTERAGQAITAQQNAAQQAVEQQRLGFQSRTAAADAALKDTQNQSAVQILSAQKRLAAARTPEEKAAAESEILALGGKRDNPQRFTVVPGGQEVDEKTGLPVRRPDRVLNNQTGQFVDQPAQRPSLPPGMTRMVGTSGGKPVYEDASGKRFIGG